MGGYYEELLYNNKISRKSSTIRIRRPITSLRKPFNMGYRKATRFHKILKLYKPVTYTLAIVGRRKRKWGYQTTNGWVDHITYRKNKNNI